MCWFPPGCMAEKVRDSMRWLVGLMSSFASDLASFAIWCEERGSPNLSATKQAQPLQRATEPEPDQEKRRHQARA